MKWPKLRREEWIVIVILDACAISTALYGLFLLLNMIGLKSVQPGTDPLSGAVLLATGAGFLWYVSRPILNPKPVEKRP